MAYIIPTIHPAYVLRQGRPVSDVIAADLAKAFRISQGDGPHMEEHILHVTPYHWLGPDRAVAMALDWMDYWLREKPPLGVDVETGGLDFFTCPLYSCALGDAANSVAVAFALGDLHILPPEHEAALVERLRLILADEAITKIFHNSPFDRAVLYRKGLPVRGPTLDTMGMAHIIQPDAPKDLGWTGHSYLDVGPWKLDHESGKMANTKDPVQLLVYNGRDALYTAKLAEPMHETIRKRGMSDTLISWQMAFADLATEMELSGIPVDMDRRRQIAATKRDEMDARQRWMRDYLRWPDFNPMSTAHRVEALFGPKYIGDPWNLGLNPTKRTKKTQSPSTSYKAIIDHYEHPFVRCLAEYIETRHTYATQYKDGTLTVPGSSDRETPGAYQRAICDDGRIHVKWNPVGQVGTRFSSQPNCFSADTEVLTERGWLPFPEARKLSARPFQYDPKHNTASVAPTAEYVKTSSRHWVQLNTKAIDHLSTANHRTLVEHTVQREKQKVRELITVPAIELVTRCFNRGALRSRSGSLRSAGQDIPKALVVVLCACQADGWRRKYGKGEAWSFYFAKARKVKRLTAALHALGSDASWYQKPLQRGVRRQTAIYLRDCPVKERIDAWLGPSKSFGPWLLDWSGESLRQFVDELSQWDGRASRRSEYSTTVKDNADWAQAAAVLSGARAGNVRKFWGAQSKKPCYQLSHGWTKPILGFATKHAVAQLYDHPADAYCATVPTGYIFVRRNGKACISGNCQNQRREDRAFFRTQEGRVFVAADKDQLELRLIAGFAGVPELLEEMARKGGDPHTVAAKAVYGQMFVDADKDYRKMLREMMKNVTYASMYMGQDETVWRTIRERKMLKPHIRAALDLKTVRFLKNSYFGRYTEIYDWHRANFDLARRQGFLEIPPLGRRRYYPVQPPPMTEIANWPIQTAGSDYVGMEMVLIQEELKRRFHGTAYIVLHGHDQVVAECEEKDAEEVKGVVETLFGNTVVDGALGQFRLTAKALIGRSLLDIKG